MAAGIVLAKVKFRHLKRFQVVNGVRQYSLFEIGIPIDALGSFTVRSRKFY